MIRFENECVDCGHPCMGDACKYRKVPHIICDGCGGEFTEVYDVHGEQLCEECLLDSFSRINENNVMEMIS